MSSDHGATNRKERRRGKYTGTRNPKKETQPQQRGG